MAQQNFRLALQNADFPLLSGQLGRPVIIQNQDAAQQQQAKFSQYRPKISYMHNCLPISEGLKSIAYNVRVAAAAPAVISFDEIWTVNDVNGNFGLFSPAAGANFLSPAGGAWILGTAVVPAVGFGASHAEVGGQSYICWGRVDVYTIDCATGVLVSAALTGINPALDINGITSANNYLIAWNDYTVFWSNPLNPADFVPSLTTGAGSGSPSELKGKIIACYPYLNGFFIYSTEGILLAQYSGNTQYPWIFKDIAGAMAIMDAENVTHGAVDLYNIALTAGGFIKFSAQGSEPIFPEVADFLAAKQFEDYNAGVWTNTTLANSLNSRVTRVSSRYVVISYGQVAGLFTHALVYDTSLQRWGKLKISHTYCFSFPSQLSTNPMHQIAFASSDGTVSTVDPGFGLNTGAACVIVGGISMTRGTWLTLHEVEVNAFTGEIYTVSDLPSSDGIVLDAPQLLTAASNGYYPTRITALAHNLAIEGNFTLSNLQATTVQFGVR